MARKPNVILSTATNALIATQNVGLPWTLPLSDKQPLGSFWVRVGVAIGTTATNVPISLPRKPSGCITINSTTGNIVYQTAGDQAASTPALFVCRSLAATVATILVG